MKRVYGLILRASFVIACVAALASVYHAIVRNDSEMTDAFSRRHSYECMSRVTDEELERRAKNQYGNYNARLVGCSGQDFFGSPEELLLIRRSGIDKLIPVPRINFKVMTMDAAAAFILWGLTSLLLAGLVVLAYRVGRWIWTGTWALEQKSN